jgi:formyl-CoA transferase
LNDAGVPSGPIYDIDEMFADPQVEHVGVAKPVQHPQLGEIRVLKNAINLSSTPDVDYRPTPERGEHTDTVLAEFGYSAEEIERFRTAGVV